MSNTDLYIIAAGNGSRLNSKTPKALVPIVEEPCLTTTLQQIAHKFRRVFVVFNVHVREQWHAYFADLDLNYPEIAERTSGVAIQSGLGDGHATLQGILATEKTEDGVLCRDVVVAWGDVFFPHAEIIDELLQITLIGSGIFPVVYETNPYVALLVDENMRCICAEFSKYGEHHAAGFHDQSVFRFDLARLKSALTLLHNSLWKNGRYLTTAGELSLLFTFHHLYNSGDPTCVYETAYHTRSFNTVEEVAAIQREISARWYNKFRAQRAGEKLDD